jgi:hypothetical protein
MLNKLIQYKPEKSRTIPIDS